MRIRRTTARKAPTRTRQTKTPLFDASGSLKVGGMDKRALILAHHAARSGRPIGGRLAYYIGIAACAAVVVAGWWLTLNVNLRSGLHASGPGLIQTAKNEVARQQQERPLVIPKQELQQALDRVPITEERLRQLQQEIDQATSTTGTRKE